MTPPLETPASRAVIALIGIAAILSNALVLWIFYRRRKKSVRTVFDMLIINLAVSDLISGIFIFFSRFVFQPQIPENYTCAMAYCYLLWGSFIVFGCGIVSIYSCLVLTIERWLAIVKPNFYGRVEPRHAKCTIAVIWIWSFLIDSTLFFSVNANVDSRSCNWVDPKMGRVFFAFIEISMSSVLPFSLIIILHAHIFYKVRKMKKLLKNKKHFKKRLTNIALAASVALIVGWLPTKISYMLRYTSVGAKHLDGTVYLVFVTLSLSNGFINPFLYGIYSWKFRDEYKEVLSDIMCNIMMRKISMTPEKKDAEMTSDIQETECP